MTCARERVSAHRTRLRALAAHLVVRADPILRQALAQDLDDLPPLLADRVDLLADDGVLLCVLRSGVG
jgi:hypothetical protein